jgi:hypothetical protein
LSSPFKNFSEYFIGISHNVPAVYDIFARPENRGFPGLAKMWVGRAWEAQPT